MSKIRKYTPPVCIIVVVFLLGGGIGYTVCTSKFHAFLTATHLVRLNDPSNPLVHPIIGYYTPTVSSIGILDHLKDRMKVAMEGNKNVVSRYSIYFRDNTLGYWVGLNEDDKFDAGSMLKVAMAMSAYKEAQQDPHFLESWVQYSKSIADINLASPYNTGV